MRDDLLSSPDSAAYGAATTPHNATAVQRPAVVAHARSADDVADAVRWAAQHDLQIAVQASGHGAGATIGADHLLVDTSELNSVDVDVAGRLVRVGAGATWSAVNAVAERDGLLGLAGSSPTVGVAGYTFGGGVGYLTRPHGMASSALLAVDYVDGNGQTRRATEDADDVIDREALWAFRGGGGVGVATALTVELVEPRELWAGYQLWRVDALESVAEAWANAMAQIGDALSTTLSVLHTPPGAPCSRLRCGGFRSCTCPSHPRRERKRRVHCWRSCGRRLNPRSTTAGRRPTRRDSRRFTSTHPIPLPHWGWVGGWGRTGSARLVRC